MTRISSYNPNPARRLNRKQGIIVCDKLPGRFPDSVEYRPCNRISPKRKSVEPLTDVPVNFCFGRVLSF